MRPAWPGPSATIARPPESATTIRTGWAAAGRRYVPVHDEACAVESVRTKFKATGYNVQELLLALTQSPAFLTLPAVPE